MRELVGGEWVDVHRVDSNQASSVRVEIGFSFRFEISQVFASLPLNLVIFMYIVLTKVQNLEVIYKIP